MAYAIGGLGYDNTERVDSQQPIDLINSQFYTRYPYPWTAHIIRRTVDPTVESELLAQAVGEWSGTVLPPRPRVWVAGCGTNQSVLTALRFPASQVLGTDVSPGSLDASAELAEQLTVDNLTLTAQSINDAEYDAEFDHVICTGVIHHNADPQAALGKLARALTPDGVLELMVYNRYHCVESTAVQKAVALLSTADHDSRFDDDLDIAKKLVHGRENLKQRIARYFVGMEHSDAALADALIQPVMHTFTVLDLYRMADACGLELVLPCANQFDVARRCLDWNLTIADRPLRARYEALPDEVRWQVTNLVALEQSPMIWFYLRRRDSTRPRRSERDVLTEFGNQVFEVADTTSEVFVRTPAGTYELAGTRHGGHPADETAKQIVAKVAEHGSARMSDVFAELSLPTDLGTLSRARTQLTTPALPYLRRVRELVSGGDHSSHRS
jgi:SAM-dependent methyltransferase